MSARVKEGLTKFHGEKEFTSTGVIGPTADNPWLVGGENQLRVVVENVGGGNSITVFGRIRNQTAYSTLATVVGATAGTTVDISLIDEVYFNCTVYAASGGTPKLVASGFFKLASSGSSDTASNLGAGAGVFDSKVGNDFQFKSLVAGSGITLTPSATEISIAANASPKLSLIFNTSPTTAVGDLVRVTGIDTVDTIADNSAATIPNGVFGVALAKPTATTVEVVFTGIVPGYAGFTPGDSVYVSTTGVVTQSAPVTGMWQQIGFATSTTELFVNLKTPLEQL